jgi:hypothetical protein
MQTVPYVAKVTWFLLADASLEAIRRSFPIRVGGRKQVTLYRAHARSTSNLEHGIEKQF